MSPKKEEKQVVRTETVSYNHDIRPVRNTMSFRPNENTDEIPNRKATGVNERLYSDESFGSPSFKGQSS